MSNDTQQTPPAETWAYLSLQDERYEMKFPTRAAAVAALEGKEGEVVRYERRLPRKGLERLFPTELLLEELTEFLSTGDIIGNHEDGLFEVSEAEEDDLSNCLADALCAWFSKLNPPVWHIVERYDAKEPISAEDPVP